MPLFSYHSIKDYHTNLLSGQTTSREAVQFYLDQIERNKHLNAYLEVFEKEALARADELDALRTSGAALGKLHGVVIGLKDVIAYKGHKLSASSKILEGFTSIYNATVVERLLAEGAIIIGRHNCDEFAMGSSNENSAYGKVLNAQDNERVPGGSSGGSAVAVQAALCMVSLGSDTGGSVRQPADFCGVIGLKPTYGRISRYGLIAYASSFDQIGVFGNTTDDVSLVLEVIAGPDEFDSTATSRTVPAYSKRLKDEMRPLKIAYFREALEHPGLDPEIAKAFRAFTEKLTTMGFAVEEIDFELLKHIVPTYYILTTAEASSNLSRYDGIKYGFRKQLQKPGLEQLYKQSRSEGFGKEVKRRIMLGTFVLSAGYFDAYYAQAQKVRRKLSEKTEYIFSEYDAIISPTVPSPAFRFGEKSDPIEMFLADIYTVFANLTGIPAISLPLFVNAAKMPFGLQVMTSKFNELLLLRLSKKIMEMYGKE